MLIDERQEHPRHPEHRRCESCQLVERLVRLGVQQPGRLHRRNALWVDHTRVDALLPCRGIPGLGVAPDHVSLHEAEAKAAPDVVGTLDQTDAMTSGFVGAEFIGR